jgi:hypothetical protein
MFRYIILVIVCLVVVLSCKKDKLQPEMSVLNAGCDCAKEVSADFTIFEISWYQYPDELSTETDTIFSQKNVRFVANEEGASYKWIIGSETLTGKTIVRYFDETWKGQEIHIKLIVTKNPNKICLPNDDGIDTIEKTFFVSNQPGNFQQSESFLMEGTYRVKDVNSSDSVEVVIDYYYNSSQDYGIKVNNYDGFGSVATNHDFTLNYREIRTDWYYFPGFFKYKINGEAEFIFTDRLNSPNKDYHYKGRKL